MPKFDRRAEWIWRPRNLTAAAFEMASPRLAEETNRYVYFRHSLEMDQGVTSAPVYASADGRYQLFVNGVRVGRGPARCSSLFQTMDLYDLAFHLKKGRNVIAALAHSYGRNTAWYELPGGDHGRAFGCGGFFLQGDAVTESGARICLDTDGSWRCLVAEAWQTDVASNSLGFMEIYDARRAPQGWAGVGLDDGGWQTAEVLRVAGRNFSGDVIPFANLGTREIPSMREGWSTPARIAGIHEVAETPRPDLAEQIAQECFAPLTHCKVTCDSIEVETVDGYAVSIVYDFGEILTGYIGLNLDGPDGAIADIVYGEQLNPDGRVKIFGGIAGFDAVPAHRYTLREGTQSWERFEWNGLRYLQVTYRNCERPLRILGVGLCTTEYPVEDVGAFSCSDDLLNRIWRAGAKTLRRCMHDGYVDCPSREQRQWMDAYIEARINYAAFGDARLAAQALKQFAQSQRADGLTMMAAPGDFSLSGFTNIPDFCLYWIMMIDDHVLYTGDTQIAAGLYPSVVKAIRWFEDQLNDENLLTDVPHWVFVDWAELDKQGQVTALNAHFVAALAAAARLARIMECGRDAARFEALVKEITSSINARLWNDGRGLYADARRHGRLSNRISQQANAAAIAHGVAPSGRWHRIFEAILDDANLVLTRPSSREESPVPFDEKRNIVLAQPFFMHIVHRAMRAAGLHDQIVGNIRKRWADMLEDSGSTFRETWQLEDITSKCHAWSATPVFDLSTDVLGVSPAAPGFSRVQIAPHIAGLEWARGRYPTPHGAISVAWEFRADRFVLTIDIPAGCEGIVVCPLSGGWQMVDGSVAPGPASVTAGPGAHRLVG